MIDLYLFRIAFKDLVRIKRLLPIIALAAVPLLISIAWQILAGSHKVTPDEVYDRLAEGLIFGFLLEILACVFATGVISQEVEQKTVVYLLTRPVPRWRVLLVKFLAATLATTLAAYLSIVMLHLSTYGLSLGKETKSTLGHDLLILPVACAAYSAAFLLLATILQRPLVVGLIYAFGIETWAPSLPGNFKKVSLLAYIRKLASHSEPSSGVDPNNPLAPILNDTLTRELAWQVLIGTTIVALGLALYLFSVREYVPRDDT